LYSLFGAQYLLTSWILVTCLEGIFTKYSNAGIEGNLAVLLLYLVAMLGNCLAVDFVGELVFYGLPEKEEEEIG